MNLTIPICKLCGGRAEKSYRGYRCPDWRAHKARGLLKDYRQIIMQEIPDSALAGIFPKKDKVETKDV